MKKYIYIITLLLASLTISCNQGIDENNSQQDIKNKITLSPEEYISIAYDQRKEVGNTEIESIINKFLEIQVPKKTKKENNYYSIEIKERYYINQGQDSLYTKSTYLDKEETSLTKIPILKVKTSDGKNNGLVYISPDERFPDILAYIPNTINADTLSTDNKFKYKLLLKKAEDVLLYKDKIYNQIKDSLRFITRKKISDQFHVDPKELSFEEIIDLIEIKDTNVASTKSTINQDPANGQTLLSKIGPYIFSEWSQTAPYNNSMGGSCTDWLGDPINYNVSASIVATAQIFAFFEPSLNANGTQINWPYLMEKSKIIEPDYFNAGDPIAKRNMIAALMKFCSDKCAVSYTCSGSTYYMSNIVNFWKSYGINADASKSFNFSTIKTALDNAKLTFCQGKTSSNGGHSWLIDGYMVVSPTGSVSNTNSYVHANMGMGSYYNGYYLVNSNTGTTFDPGFAHFTKDIIMYTNVGR